MTITREMESGMADLRVATEAVNRVCDALRAWYGDAITTARDRQVAHSIVQVLCEAGWCPPNMIAAILEAAGGSVTVTDRQMVDPPSKLVREDLFDGIRLTAVR